MVVYWLKVLDGFDIWFCFRRACSESVLLSSLLGLCMMSLVGRNGSIPSFKTTKGREAPPEFALRLLTSSERGTFHWIEDDANGRNKEMSTFQNEFSYFVRSSTSFVSRINVCQMRLESSLVKWLAERRLT